MTDPTGARRLVVRGTLLAVAGGVLLGAPPAEAIPAFARK